MARRGWGGERVGGQADAFVVCLGMEASLVVV